MVKPSPLVSCPGATSASAAKPLSSFESQPAPYSASISTGPVPTHPVLVGVVIPGDEARGPTQPTSRYHRSLDMRQVCLHLRSLQRCLRLGLEPRLDIGHSPLVAVWSGVERDLVLSDEGFAGFGSVGVDDLGGRGKGRRERHCECC